MNTNTDTAQSATSSELIPLEKINAVEVFTKNGMDTLLARIQDEVKDFVPDMETQKGRNECKSLAYKIVLSKGVIDRAGKEFVSDLKDQVKVVDESRKKAREFLDELSTDVRRPLTEFEQAEEARIQAEKLQAEIEAAHDEALLADEVWETRRKLAELEAREAARIEAERQAEEARIAEEQRKAEADRLAKEQADRDAMAQQEAEERGRQAAASALEREKQAREQAEKRAEEQAEQAKRDQDAAVERERLRVIREQEEREAEKARIAAKQKAEDDKRQADQNHRRSIHAAALKAFVDEGFTEDDGKKIITVIFQKKIPNVQIVY